MVESTQNTDQSLISASRSTPAAPRAAGPTAASPALTGAATFEVTASYRMRWFLPEPLIPRGIGRTTEGKRVVFPCGAILKDGKWIVSYGYNDVAVRFATFDQEEIEKRLTRINGAEAIAST